MSYSGRTDFYNIPYMKAGDILIEDNERQQLQIIDGLLYAATMGGSNCIIQDASYTLSNTTSANASLLLSASGEHVITALVGKRVTVLEDPATLSLPSGGTYYIYLRTTENIDSDPTSCEVVSLTERNDSDGSILLAIVDYSGASATLDTDTGKLYLTAIQSHILDNVNPHGDTLEQSTLNVTSHLRVNGNEMYGCVYKTVTTGGPSGTAVSVTELTPRYVTAMSANASVGTITFGLGADSVTVYNSGSTGIEIVVKVEG